MNTAHANIHPGGMIHKWRHCGVVNHDTLGIKLVNWLASWISPGWRLVPVLQFKRPLGNITGPHDIVGVEWTRLDDPLGKVIFIEFCPSPVKRTS